MSMNKKQTAPVTVNPAPIMIAQMIQKGSLRKKISVDTFARQCVGIKLSKEQAKFDKWYKGPQPSPFDFNLAQRERLEKSLGLSPEDRRKLDVMAETFVAARQAKMDALITPSPKPTLSKNKKRWSPSRRGKHLSAKAHALPIGSREHREPCLPATELHKPKRVRSKPPTTKLSPPKIAVPTTLLWGVFYCLVGSSADSPMFRFRGSVSPDGKRLSPANTPQYVRDAAHANNRGSNVTDPERIAELTRFLKTKKSHKNRPVSLDTEILHYLRMNITCEAPTMNEHGTDIKQAESVQGEESEPVTYQIGQFTGIRQIDTSLGGAKKGELWTHASLAGGFRSTFALNWAYNQAVYMKYDSCVVSLEMTYDQCMDIICAMHSMHPKFVDIRIELGLQHGDSGPSTGLDYDKIRNGKLTPAEGTFLLDHVIPDFESGAKSGEYGKIHIETSSFTVADLKSKAESLYFRTPFSLLFVDHSGLLAPRRHHGNNATDRVNEVIRDLKGLAMDFNRGSGMAVVEMSQILRGQLVGGLQIPHTLSSIPDNGRSSDVVTASSSLLSGSRILFQCLKARNAASPFPDFQSRITSSRRILSCDS